MIVVTTTDVDMPLSQLSLFTVSSAFTYIKFFSVWMFVLMADFILDFRFEYLWPLWLLARSVCDSMKYQGLVSSSRFQLSTVV